MSQTLDRNLHNHILQQKQTGVEPCQEKIALSLLLTSCRVNCCIAIVLTLSFRTNFKISKMVQNCNLFTFFLFSILSKTVYFRYKNRHLIKEFFLNVFFAWKFDFIAISQLRYSCWYTIIYLVNYDNNVKTSWGWAGPSSS